MRLFLTTNQKRFLIVWVIFHFLALFVNIADVRGLTNPSLPENGKTGYQICLFTQYGHDGFWPFVQFYKENYEQLYATSYGKIVYFNGLFYSYDLSAFVFYMLVGLGVVFIPRLWSPSSEKSQSDT